MCGIIGVIVKDNHKELIRNLYNIFVNQQDRGTQGAGISIHNGDTMFRYRTVSPFRLFNVYNFWFWQKITVGSKVLIHHRTPTSTINEAKYNHPIANEDNSVHIIHNGIISNDTELFKTQKSHHTFETKQSKKKFTDSEVIVHAFEDSYNGNVTEALLKVGKTVEGSYAVAMSIRGEDCIYLIRHSNPIIIFQDEQGNLYFASEYDTYSSKFTRIHELEDGEIGKLSIGEGYVKLATLDIPKPKYVYSERKWDDDDENDTHRQALITDGFAYGYEGDKWADGYGHTYQKKGDFWELEDEKIRKEDYDD